MATYRLYSKQGIRFATNPKAVKNPYGKGWVIQCRSDDPTLFDGNYVRAVGFADIAESGNVAFRLKRDAERAIAEGIAYKIFVNA